eukprot:TRINITY_DN4773_c0_g1_i5.p1 TRINITY_DN4773_c0_g1~~TRINITY_DN4773_c0_g1_i5.p1  ORF type:complete len:306 (-),score=47.43 TRINITY_DN4773_c0_g1_i5:159-1076(-)
MDCQWFFFFFFQAEDGIRDVERSRGLGDVYKRQYQRRVHGDHSLDMMLMNSVITLNELPRDFITMGLNTWISVENRPYLKPIEKLLTSPINNLEKGGQVCMATALLPAMLEVQNKARDFIYVMDQQKIELSSTVKDLVYAMPKLEEKYNPSLKTFLGCRPSPGKSIIRINDTKIVSDEVQVQIPIDCIFGIQTLGVDLLGFTFVVRSNLISSIDINTTGAYVKSFLSKPQMYNFKITKHLVPVSEPDYVLMIASRISVLLENFPVVPPGLHFQTSYPISKHHISKTAEEYCFTMSRGQSLSLIHI